MNAKCGAQIKQRARSYARVHYVYTLSSSKSGRVFYVGKGCGRRAYAHRVDAKNGKETPAANHIRGLWLKGEDVVETIIAKFGNSSDACIREREEIAARAGLLNRNTGGSGTGTYDFRPSRANPDQHARFWSAIIGSPVVRAKGRQRI